MMTSSPVFFIFLLLTLLLTASSDLNEEDRNALLSFINNITLPTISRYKWNPKAKSPCEEWDGVECAENLVIRLQLPGASLIGKIPPDTLGKITSLRVLSLRHNGLFGPLPADFANLRELRRVFLHNNNFTGTIPSDINLKQIKHFNLANNNFSGTLPDIFPSSLKPEKFSVSNNKLSGPIPSSLTRFPLKAFSDNFELCGEPLNKTCDPNKYPPPPPPKKKKKKLSIGYIVAIAVGSALILLILLLCLGKKLSQVVKEKKAPVVATMAAESAAKAERESGGGGKAGTSSS